MLKLLTKILFTVLYTLVVITVTPFVIIWVGISNTQWRYCKKTYKYIWTGLL